MHQLSRHAMNSAMLLTMLIPIVYLDLLVLVRESVEQPKSPLVRCSTILVAVHKSDRYINLFCPILQLDHAL